MARGEWWFGTADIGKSIGNASCSFSCFADPVKFLNTWPNSSLSYLWCSKLQKDALKAAQPYLPHNFTIYFLLCNLVLWTAASLFPESSQNIAAIEQWKKIWLFWFCWGLCSPCIYIYIIYHTNLIVWLTGSTSYQKEMVSPPICLFFEKVCHGTTLLANTLSSTQDGKKWPRNIWSGLFLKLMAVGL